MKPLDSALLFGAGAPLLAAIVFMAARKGSFVRDAFPSAFRRRAALVLLFLCLIVTVLLPAGGMGRAPDISRLRFIQVFAVQAVLATFLLGWWLLAGRPPVSEFLALNSKAPLAEAGVGVSLGLIGWALTLLVGVGTALFLSFFGFDGARAIPPLVKWIAALPPLQRGLIVLSAMTVEEFYFRAFLQRRIGAVPASILFLLGHAGYGEPLFFVGLLAITTVLASAFRRTGSVWAPILAHGTFDAVQLFIVLPAVLKFLGER
jgi:membrane protease YdiL (CAAX protease family)